MKTLLPLLLLLAACHRDSSREAANLESCPAVGCSGSNICLKPLNICVKPCDTHLDCPSGMLCRGYFKDVFNFTGKGQQFCKLAKAVEGMSCDSLKSSCVRGLACVDGVCRKRCIDDNDCLKHQRCAMEVLPTHSFAPEATYKVCAKAPHKVGEECTPGSEPYCQKGLVCVTGRCRIECMDDSSCPVPQRCTQSGYLGWRGRLRMLAGEDPDFHYCR